MREEHYDWYDEQELDTLINGDHPDLCGIDEGKVEYKYRLEHVVDLNERPDIPMPPREKAELLLQIADMAMRLGQMKEAWDLIQESVGTMETTMSHEQYAQWYHLAGQPHLAWEHVCIARVHHEHEQLLLLALQVALAMEQGVDAIDCMMRYLDLGGKIDDIVDAVLNSMPSLISMTVQRKRYTQEEEKVLYTLWCMLIEKLSWTSRYREFPMYFLAFARMYGDEVEVTRSLCLMVCNAANAGGQRQEYKRALFEFLLAHPLHFPSYGLYQELALSYEEYNNDVAMTYHEFAVMEGFPADRIYSYIGMMRCSLRLGKDTAVSCYFDQICKVDEGTNPAVWVKVLDAFSGSLLLGYMTEREYKRYGKIALEKMKSSHEVSMDRNPQHETDHEVKRWITVYQLVLSHSGAQLKGYVHDIFQGNAPHLMGVFLPHGGYARI